MTDIALLKLGHILCLVYWLGADLGVFYSSYFLADDKLSTETRLAMAKLLFALDQAPRICMPLILAFGVHLAWRLGMWPIPGSIVIVTWLICLGWLAMVLVLHVRGHSAAGLTRFDFGFRVTLVAGLVAFSAYAIANQQMATWLALKLLVFAGLVFCGLMIRRRLKPFGPAFSALAGGQAGDAENSVIRGSLSATRPFVVTIWLGLLLNTALGLHLF